jgi:hypothetical protein
MGTHNFRLSDAISKPNNSFVLVSQDGAASSSSSMSFSFSTLLSPSLCSEIESPLDNSWRGMRSLSYESLSFSTGSDLSISFVVSCKLLFSVHT